MDENRINSPLRLDGIAKCIGLAAKRGWILAFPRRNIEGVGTSSIVQGDPEDVVIGVIYDVPAVAVERLAQVEGVNSGSYRKVQNFRLEEMRGSALAAATQPVIALTYLAVEQPGHHPTSAEYANHILRGILSHGMPRDYFHSARRIILRNNPSLERDLLDADDESAGDPTQS
jgi:hypothetical protein